MIFVNVSRLLLLQLLLAAAMAVTVTFVAWWTGLSFYDGSSVMRLLKKFNRCKSTAKHVSTV